MGSGIYVAMAGAVAQSDALDTVANNIANAGTTGFRAERLRFTQALARARGKDAAYVRAAGGNTDTTAGNIEQTGNPLDLTLTTGDGYFAVDTARGVRYTRAGHFNLDAGGRLVTPDGAPLRSVTGKPIIAPAGAGVTIRTDGSVMTGDEVVGVLDLQRFRPQDLSREGATLYVAHAAPQAGPKPEVSSGAVEQGNFNVVRGVVDLVRVSRTYEALHRMIESYKEIDQRAARGSGS